MKTAQHADQSAACGITQPLLERGHIDPRGRVTEGNAARAEVRTVGERFE